MAPRPPEPNGIRPAQAYAIIAATAVSGVLPQLQPLLLGTLVSEGRLTIGQIGPASTAETLGMAVAATLAGALLPPKRLRFIATAALCGVAVLSVLTTTVSGTPILLVRGLSGACGGLLVWLVFGMLARIDSPARISGIYGVGQGACGVTLMFSLSSFVLPRFGASGGYFAIAGVSLAMLAAVLFMPRSYAPLETKARIALPNLPGAMALIGAGVYGAAVVALWAYLLPIGLAKGYSRETVSLALTISIAFQMLAGFAAIRFAHLRPATTLFCCLLGSLLAVAAITAVASPLVFIAAMTVISFLYVLAVSYQVPFNISLDATRRGVMLLSGAQIFGVSCGPLLASIFVTRSALPALWSSAALFAAALVCLLSCLPLKVVHDQRAVPQPALG